MAKSRAFSSKNSLHISIRSITNIPMSTMSVLSLMDRKNSLSEVLSRCEPYGKLWPKTLVQKISFQKKIPHSTSHQHRFPKTAEFVPNFVKSENSELTASLDQFIDSSSFPV